MTSPTQTPTIATLTTEKPMPDRVKARLCAHIAVYSKAVAALILTEPVHVRKLWRELIPDSERPENTTLLNKIHAVASALADKGSGYEVDSILEVLSREEETDSVP